MATNISCIVRRRQVIILTWAVQQDDWLTDWLRFIHPSIYFESDNIWPIQQHVYIARSSVSQKWRIASTTGFNDDFMGLKRMFAVLAIIYLTDRPKRRAHDKAHKLHGPMKYNYVVWGAGPVRPCPHHLFCRPVAF